MSDRIGRARCRGSALPEFTARQRAPVQPPHYSILDVHGRYFVEIAQAAGLGSTIIRQAVDEIFAGVATVPDAPLAAMPHDFLDDIHTTVVGAINIRITGFRPLSKRFEPGLR